MVGIIAPMKATVSVIDNNGKSKSRTMMLDGNAPVAHADTILDAVKMTAGIVDAFAKGWHVDTITELENGDIKITACKDDSE